MDIALKDENIQEYIDGKINVTELMLSEPVDILVNFKNSKL